MFTDNLWERTRLYAPTQAYTRLSGAPRTLVFPRRVARRISGLGEPRAAAPRAVGTRLQIPGWNNSSLRQAIATAGESRYFTHLHCLKMDGSHFQRLSDQLFTWL
ncbi:hypothetical protein M8J75_015503 [Diaphorina citri]|nr:hypothetical protein M8J75_015503 [Diaphorina citri]